MPVNSFFFSSLVFPVFKIMSKTKIKKINKNKKAWGFV